MLLADGNARAALELVKKVQTELTSSQQELHDNLKEIVSAEARLSSLLKEAKSSGAMKQKSVVELLSHDQASYLKLNPNMNRLENSTGFAAKTYKLLRGRFG